MQKKHLKAFELVFPKHSVYLYRREFDTTMSDSFDDFPTLSSRFT